MKLKTALSCLLIILSTISSAQEATTAKTKRKTEYISLAFTNSHTAMPFASFSRLVTGKYHPGFEVSTGFNWKSRSKHDWTQSISLGYSYHRWVQHSLVLYTEFGYRYKLPGGFSADMNIGGGYMRAIIATEAFSDGVRKGAQYSKFSSGRSQAIGTLTFGVSKKINSGAGPSFFLQYQQRMQTPFIASYVPVLPYNIMKVGIAISLNNKPEKKPS